MSNICARKNLSLADEMRVIPIRPVIIQDGRQAEAGRRMAVIRRITANL